MVWVQIRDSVGNWSEPYPAYAPLPGEVPGGQDSNSIYLPLIQANRPTQVQQVEGSVNSEWEIYLPAIER